MNSCDNLALDTCTIGKILNEECHKLIYCRKAGLLNIDEFPVHDKKLLQWRCHYQFEGDNNICFHHEKMYLSRYESLQKFCADPFRVHKKHITSKFKCVFFLTLC